MQRAMTLIEVLAVVSILALASSMALISVAGMEDAGALRRALMSARDFDARVRILARAERSIEIHVGSAGAALEAIDPTSPDAEPILRLELPRGVAVDISWAPPDAWPGIDRRGRSADYALTLRRGDVVRGMLVRGLTGQVLFDQTE